MSWSRSRQTALFVVDERVWFDLSRVLDIILGKFEAERGGTSLGLDRLSCGPQKHLFSRCQTSSVWQPNKNETYSLRMKTLLLM